LEGSSVDGVCAVKRAGVIDRECVSRMDSKGRVGQWGDGAAHGDGEHIYVDPGACIGSAGPLGVSLKLTLTEH
jgi:hypothetical protein